MFLQKCQIGLQPRQFLHDVDVANVLFHVAAVVGI